MKEKNYITDFLNYDKNDSSPKILELPFCRTNLILKKT